MAEDENENDYESDPEEAKMSLKMRRREASDDEDGEVPQLRVSIVDSEGESDGQGGADNYDDDEEEEYCDEVEDEVGEGEYEEIEIGSGGGAAENGAREAVAQKGVEETIEGNEETGESQGQGEEEKKENEPFAVPTSGAFYMHDDRFRDNAAGRNRRTFDGKRLWESKDDRKWGHDKFEELDTRENSYEEGRRSSKGYYQGRGKGRGGADRGYAQGNRTMGFGGNSNQNVGPKVVRGREPRRYQPSMKNKSGTLPSHNKQSAKPLERTINTGFGRNSAYPNAEHESVPAKKVASNLSSASPPFYPSASSNKETALTTKKEALAATNNRSVRPSVTEHSFSMPRSDSVFRGKNVNDSIVIEKLHIDDSVSPSRPKALNNTHLSSSASSSSASQMPQSRAQDRSAAPSVSVFKSPQISNQINRVLPPAAQALQQNPGQNRTQTPLQVSGQQLDQHALASSPQGSSPPKAGKGTGKGSLAYGGSQVMGSGGSMSSTDPNLPAFFPVMPFGGQHPGSMGVPAVGMAFPGYVAQPNGLGNSEMTWLPVLAGAAGALGATYCPPYIALDGSYHPQPIGHSSALPNPSKDNNSPSIPHNELKPQPRSEVSHDHEFSHRQNKPRRYSEMSFSQ